jgi:hypothetical protein
MQGLQCSEHKGALENGNSAGLRMRVENLHRARDDSMQTPKLYGAV